MATQILAAGTTAADSADVTIAAGAQLTVCLKDADGAGIIGGSQVKISLKDDAGLYVEIDALSSMKPALVIVGAGTYRFSRLASGPSVGVFSA